MPQFACTPKNPLADERGRRVAIVDDSVLIRQMLAVVFNDTPGIEVVGEAADGGAGVALVEQTHPDAVILDNNMPGLSGLEVIPRIRIQVPAVEIIMFSADPTVEQAALEVGADAFFVKGDAGPVDLVDFLLGAPASDGPGTVGYAVVKARAAARTRDAAP